jgi:hypothetical protein
MRTGLLPEVAIEAAEKGDGLMIPGPSKVVGQFVERGETLRQRGPDMECPYGTHGSGF